jgi:hypothetical protein
MAWLIIVDKGIESGEWCAEKGEDGIWAILGVLSVAVEVELIHPERSIGRDGLSRILNIVFNGMSAKP